MIRDRDEHQNAGRVNEYGTSGEGAAQPEQLASATERLAELHHERERLSARLREQTAKADLLSSVVLRCQRLPDVKAALQCVVVQTCHYTGWPCGQAYASTSGTGQFDTLRPMGIWYLQDPERYTEFQRVAEQMRSVAGRGLPGLALASRKPVWIRNVREDDSYPRQVLTGGEPVVGAFALPLVIDDRVEAVLEFFSLKPIEPDRMMAEVADQIGHELGAMIHRKRTEALTRSSAQRFRRLAERAPIPLLSVNHCGEIWYLNRAAEQLFGYDRNELVGRRITNLLPRRHRVSFERLIERLPTDPGHRHLLHHTFQIDLKRKDGQKLPVECIAAAWHSDHEELYTVIVHDLRKRRQVEARAHQTQQRLRRLLLEVNLREQHERWKVANHLHENLGQLLAGCQMYLSHLSGDPEAAHLNKTLTQVTGLIHHALHDVRVISHRLSPPELKQLGMAAALKWLARKLRMEAGIELEVVDAEQAEGLDESVRTVVFELLREVMTSLGEHGCQQLRLTVVRDNEQLRLLIASVAAATHLIVPSTATPGRLGLDSVELSAAIERLTSLGGAMSTDWIEGSARQIRIAVPWTSGGYH